MRPWYRLAVRRLVIVAFGLLGCGPPAEPGLCESNAEVEIGVETFERFVMTALSDGDRLPVFYPPQGGIATELDLLLRGVGFQTVSMVAITVDRSDDGARLAEVSYSGDGLPLECVQDGELMLRAVPVPFSDDLVLEMLDDTDAEVTVRLERTDGEVAEDVQAVILETTDF